MYCYVYCLQQSCRQETNRFCAHSTIDSLLVEVAQEMRILGNAGFRHGTENPFLNYWKQIVEVEVKLKNSSLIILCQSVKTIVCALSLRVVLSNHRLFPLRFIVVVALLLVFIFEHLAHRCNSHKRLKTKKTQ